MLDWFMATGGLVLLFAGGESLVRGAVGLSRRFGVSELIISLTLVGFGTSMPELLVSASAALSNKPGIALGNVVGSNIANVLLILGLTTLIAPISGWDRAVRYDALAMFAATLAVAALSLAGTISAFAGFFLLALLAAYLFVALRQSKGESLHAGHADHFGGASRTPVLIGFVALGLASLFGGAHLLVQGATAITITMGVSQTVIGLTVVAVGTSLPELATSLVAALRRNSAVSIGNIVGSNIFNLLGILGLTAVLAPVPVSQQMKTVDMPVMLAVTLLLVTILWFFSRIARPAGAAMLMAYIAYTLWLFIG